MGGKNSRRKGHNLERLIASVFRNFGFKYAKTSRAVSRLLDDSKVDIAIYPDQYSKMPFLIQCKAGYVKNRPRYEKIYQEMKEALLERFPKESEIHDIPVVLVHKMGTKENFTWTFNHDDIVDILSEYFYLKNKYDEDKGK